MSVDLDQRVEAYLALAEKAALGELKAVPWHITEGPPQVRCTDKTGEWLLCEVSSDDIARLIAASHEAAAIIREQRAEIERLRKTLKFVEANARFHLTQYRPAVMEAIDDAIAECGGQQS